MTTAIRDLRFGMRMWWSARKKALRSRNCVDVALVVFHHADTTTIRLLLGVSSLVYAVLLVWPFFFPAVTEAYCWAFALFNVQCAPGPMPEPLFARPAYALLAIVPGQEWTWAFIFTLHFLGVHWRVIDRTPSVPWGIAVNGLGFATWSYTTAALNIALGQILPGTAMEWCLVLFSGWALYRTGLQPEVVSP